VESIDWTDSYVLLTHSLNLLVQHTHCLNAQLTNGISVC